MALKISYDDFSREVIVYLLDKKDSVLLSKQLGFKFNIINRWITGTRIIKWDEFLDFCEVLGYDTNKTLAASIGYIQVSNHKETNIFSFLRDQWGDLSTKQLAKALSTDVSVINKFINGKRTPALSMILKTISLREGYLEAFLTELSNGKKHPWGYLTDHQERKNKTLINSPVSAALWACLTLEDYINLPSHSSSFLSKKLKISEKEIDQLLNFHLIHGDLTFENNKYKRIIDNINYGSASLDEQKQILSYWYSRTNKTFIDSTAKGLRKGKFPIVHALRVFPVSESALQEIYIIIKNCETEILNILEKKNQGPFVDTRIFLASFLSSEDLKDESK